MLQHWLVIIFDSLLGMLNLAIALKIVGLRTFIYQKASVLEWISREVGELVMRLGMYGGLLSGGGAERVLCTLANCLHKRGHDITFFCDHKTQGEYILDPEITLVYLDNGNESFLSRNFTRTKIIHEACKSLGIDVLLSFLRAPSFRSAVAVCGTDAAHVLSVRNDPAREYPGVARVAARGLFANSDAIVFQTAAAMSAFGDVRVPRKTVIANPVPDSCFIETDPAASHKVVTLGRLNTQKNQELLINAFADVARSDKEATLEIFGAGDLEATLQERIVCTGLVDRVRLMGRTDEPSEVFKSAGIFALSSDFEGMPNALMEAMAAGLPSVSTDCPIGGPSELIRDGETGRLVQVGDTREFAEALKELLSDACLRRRMGACAQNAMKDYRTDVIVDRWEAVLEEAYRNKHGKN